MSSAELELARRALGVWNAGDLNALEALCHPEFELRTSGIYPGLEPTYHGRSGIRQFWHDWAELWEDLALELEDLRAVGDARVLALVTFQAHGRSGIEVHRAAASLTEIRDGLIFRQQMFGSWEEARRAAGLDG